MKRFKVQAWMPLAFLAVWAVFVWRLAGRWPLGFDFTKTGQLGDSFGVVSAVMSSLAAIYAFNAFDQAKTEAEQTAASQQVRDDELTVFRMLDTRRQIIGSFKFSGAQGLAAIQEFAEDLRKASAITWPAGSGISGYPSSTRPSSKTVPSSTCGTISDLPIT